MWRAVLTFLLNFVLARLGEDLDASERAAVADYVARRRELDQTEEAAGIALARIEQEIREIEYERKALVAKADTAKVALDELQGRIDEINKKHEKALSDLNARSDADVLRSEI